MRNLKKIDLKINKITRDKEGHYIMIKGHIQSRNTKEEKRSTKSAPNN